MFPHKGEGERTMKKSRIRVKLPKQKIEDFCRRHHIRKLAVFGSALRQDFRPKSDLDVLVEFEAEHTPGLIGLAGLEIELSNLLGGRKVDMNTPLCLSRFFRDDVLAEAEPVYVAG
jgi:predicted nucleotidyltransferase